MSHYTTIQTQIKNVDALKAACAELNLPMEANALARGYAQPLKGEHVIRLKGPYDIAVNPQPDGTHSLTTDWWNGHVEREVGNGFGKLLQLYGVHQATLTARRRGYLVQRKPQANGAIKLVLTQA